MTDTMRTAWIFMPIIQDYFHPGEFFHIVHLEYLNYLHIPGSKTNVQPAKDGAHKCSHTITLTIQKKSSSQITIHPLSWLIFPFKEYKPCARENVHGLWCQSTDLCEKPLAFLLYSQSV
jgi:hypothetical protein